MAYIGHSLRLFLLVLKAAASDGGGLCRLYGAGAAKR